MQAGRPEEGAPTGEQSDTAESTSHVASMPLATHKSSYKGKSPARSFRTSDSARGTAEGAQRRSCPTKERAEEITTEEAALGSKPRRSRNKNKANKTKAGADSLPAAETREGAALVRHPGGESRRQCTAAAVAASAKARARPSSAKTTASRPKAQRSVLALPDAVSTGAPEAAGTGEEDGDRGADCVRRPIQVRQGARVTSMTSPMASTVTGWQGRDVRGERRRVERVSSDEARYGCKAPGSSATATGAMGGAEAIRATTALKSHTPAASSVSAGMEIQAPRRKSQYTRCRSMPDLLGRLVREKNVWGRSVVTLKGGSPQAPFDRRLMTDDDGLKRERFKQIVDSEAPAWGLAAECFPDSSMAKGSPKESFKRLCGSLAKRICDRVLLPREFGTGALPHGPWQEAVEVVYVSAYEMCNVDTQGLTVAEIQNVFDAKAKELITSDGYLDERVNYISRVTLIVLEKEGQASVAEVPSRKFGNTGEAVTKVTGKSAGSATAARDKGTSVSEVTRPAKVDRAACGGASSAPATPTIATGTLDLTAAHARRSWAASSERDVSTAATATRTNGRTTRPTAPANTVVRGKASPVTATAAGPAQATSQRKSAGCCPTTPMVPSGQNNEKIAARLRSPHMLPAIPEEESASSNTCQMQTSTPKGAGKRSSGLQPYTLNELVRGLERRPQGPYTKEEYQRMLETAIHRCRSDGGNNERTDYSDGGDDTRPDGAKESGHWQIGDCSGGGRTKNGEHGSHSNRGGKGGVAGKVGCRQKRSESSGGGGATEDVIRVIVKIQAEKITPASDGPASGMGSWSDKLYPAKKRLLLRPNKVESGATVEPESYGVVKNESHVAKRRKQATGSGTTVHEAIASHRSSMGSVSTVSSKRSSNNAIRSVSGENAKRETQAAGTGGRGPSKEKNATSLTAVKEYDIVIIPKTTSGDILTGERPKSVGRASPERPAEQNGGAHSGTPPQVHRHVQRASSDSNISNSNRDNALGTTAASPPSDRANATTPSRQGSAPNRTWPEPALSFQGWIAPSSRKPRTPDKGGATGARPREKSDGTKGRHPRTTKR